MYAVLNFRVICIDLSIKRQSQAICYIYIAQSKYLFDWPLHSERLSHIRLDEVHSLKMIDGSTLTSRPTYKVTICTCLEKKFHLSTLWQSMLTLLASFKITNISECWPCSTNFYLRRLELGRTCQINLASAHL